VGRTTVLAGKGSLRRAKAARPCPLCAAVQQGIFATGGSGGMAKGTSRMTRDFPNYDW